MPDQIRFKRCCQLEDVKQLSGQTLTCDGWDSNAARPLMNFIAVTPKGQKFLHSIDTSEGVCEHCIMQFA